MTKGLPACEYQDLCDREYGIFHLPSLFVFINPMSGIAEVDQILRQGLDGSRLGETVASLPDDHATALIQGTSALIHERRHFHDILVTPVGRALFRAAFGLGVASTALLKQLKGQSGEMLLPLKPTDARSEALFADVLQFACEYRDLFLSARLTLEFSATVAQLAFCSAQIGDRAVELVARDLGRDARYGVMLRLLHLAVLRGREHREEWLPTLLRYVLALLSEEPHSTARTTPHDDDLQKMFLRLIEHPAGINSIDKVRDEMHRGFVHNVGCAKEVERRGRGKLEELAHMLPHPEIIMNAWDDFRLRADAAVDMVIKDPDVFATPLRYLQARWPEPLVYLYARGTELSRRDTPIGADMPDLYDEVKLVDETGRAYYSCRLRPTVLKYAENQMDRVKWVPFMAYAGGGALVADVDWEQPFNRYWRESIARSFDIQFRHRLD